ncbi:MAG: hypothetical protein H6581_09445 [Bacteroidia bacterium]|nr:hypothetical protein [Bacteroidia bacterium]
MESEVIRYRDQNPRSLPSHFQNAVDALDQWYILEKIKFACTMVNNSAVLDTEVDIPLLKEISRHIEAMGNGNSPLILIYFRILKMLQDPGSPQQYTLFKNLLLEYAGNLPEEESRDIYTLAQNYCIRQINRGRGEFLEELFLIYESLLERGLLLENGALSPWHVKNITAVALRLKKFDWTAKFLEEKIEFVAPQFRQNAQTYNLAKLYFQKGEYSEVKKLLLQVEYEDVFYNLDSKSMLLKIYFEEGEDVALDALCRSFLAYIKRNKLISEAHRTVYRNLVRYVQRLNRLDGLGKKQLSDMLEEVESNSAVSDSSWLKRMIRIRISS